MKTTTSTLQTVLILALTILFSTKIAPAIIERGADNASNDSNITHIEDVVGGSEVDLQEMERTLTELGI